MYPAPPGSRVPSAETEVGIQTTCSIRFRKIESLIPHSGRCSARSSGAYNDTANTSEVRNGTWLIPVRSVRRMFRCAVEDSGENAFTLLSEQQAEVGEGMMMISYGYSGAGKTTTLPPV